MTSTALNHATFRRLGALEAQGHDAREARFTLGDLPLTVRAHAPGILRLTLGAPTAPDYGLVVGQDLHGNLAVSATDRGWRVAAGDLALELAREPLRITLTRNGKPVLGSITDEHFRGHSRLPAFGVDDTAPRRWLASFALASDEAIYGFGEKFGPLDKRGQLIRGRIEDALGVNTELSYKNIPFCWSSAGWGLLALTTGTTRHGVGHPQWSQRSHVLEVEDDALDLFCFAGAPAEMLERYTALTGRPALPPLWSYGMWLSRAYYRTPADALAAAQQLRDLAVPCDVITLDGRAAWEVKTRFNFQWDPARFDDPPRILAALKAHALKVCVWEYPYISIHSPLFAELERKGWLLKNREGKAAVFDWVKDPGDNPFGSVLTPLPPSGIVDFTHPDAAAWWADSHQQLFADGADVMKTDFGEQVEDDMVAANGETGRRLHNVYPLLYNRCVYEATQRFNDAHGRGPAMVWGRDGFIGSQRYPMQWGGDPQGDWEGMAASIRAGLGYGLSGVPYYATDVGGFYGSAQPDAELYLRWTANALFSSHFRYHGIGEREPWAFGAEALDIARELLRLRYRLIPYIAGAAEEAARTGLPLMRAMALAFPDDRAARAFPLQYLFGPALLFAPIVQPGGEVEVYFPRGEHWIDWASGERIEGGSVRTVKRDLDSIALWGREGHALALGRAVRHTGEIDLTAPVEAVKLFGLTRAQPCVMGSMLRLREQATGAHLAGVGFALTAAMCMPFGGAFVEDAAGGVMVRRDGNA
ncbi:MAG: alpha-xylosidase [Betaproteobacteria bacterium]|nr:alpha-xylosidase [Betaproteobacteria bacterium]